MYDCPDELAHIPTPLLWDIVHINVAAVTMMTRLLVPGMKRRARGAIVNVSSGSELQPLPYMAVYAATKVYVRHFTLAMRHELQQYGIRVQLLSPMFVRTKMNEFSSTVMAGNVFIPEVQAYTRWAVYSLGKSDVSTGYWAHGLQVNIECGAVHRGHVMSRSFDLLFCSVPAVRRHAAGAHVAANAHRGAHEPAVPRRVFPAAGAQRGRSCRGRGGR